MKRRRFFQGLVAAPAVSTLLAQQPPAGSPVNPARPVEPPPRANEELPKLETAVPDSAAEMAPRFFNAPQFAALKKLCDVLMPAKKGTPGAVDAHAPEFLDFLIGESPAERQQVYRAGLDALNAQAMKNYKKAFAEVDAAEANAMMAPLRETWTYDTPADALVRFLRVAKQDVRTATTNSREYQLAGGSAGARRLGGGGVYWYPLD